MHLKKLFITGSVLALMLASVQAGTWQERWEFQYEQDKFDITPELTFDFYPTWRVPDDESFGDGRLGTGVGVNYFFNRYFGVSGDTFIEQLDFPKHISASAVGRFPFESTGTAPYVFGGFGRRFRDGGEWLAHIGGGLDYRVNRQTGVFVDVRRTFPDRRSDYFLFRAGVRLGF